MDSKTIKFHSIGACDTTATERVVCRGCYGKIEPGQAARKITRMTLHGKVSEWYHLPLCPRELAIIQVSKHLGVELN